PQKPIAIRKESNESNVRKMIQLKKTPRIKLPIMLDNNTFETRFPNSSSKGEHVLSHILGMHPKFTYPKKKKSIPFIIYRLCRNKYL
ncbi:MAG: hypothetical protein WKF36_12000, partial [Candidatus Nitrosocosmicus sp.]